jgi:DNA-binding transcriptional ArsR family regulator
MANIRGRTGATSATLFPELAGRRRSAVGFGGLVAVFEARGRHRDVFVARVGKLANTRIIGPDSEVAIQDAARRIAPRKHAELASVLAALGSEHRLAILSGLLEGPATYRWLQNRTGLKAGPLYHHISQLRMAGLVGPKTRDVYMLTRAGRNALLAVIAMLPLLKDTRIRAQAG